VEGEEGELEDVDVDEGVCEDEKTRRDEEGRGVTVDMDQPTRGDGEVELVAVRDWEQVARHVVN